MIAQSFVAAISRSECPYQSPPPHLVPGPIERELCRAQNDPQGAHSLNGSLWGEYKVFGPHDVKGVHYAAAAICTPPRVGSTLLRQLKKNEIVHYNTTWGASSCNQVASARNHIMFIRHPGMALIAGYQHNIEKFFMGIPERLLVRGSYPTQASALGRFLMEHLVGKYECGPARSYLERTRRTHNLLAGNLLHLMPPQRCHCNFHCGARPQVFRIEEHDITQVLREHVPLAVLPSVSIVHPTRPYNASSFCDDDCLQLVNEITIKDRELFGYAPLTHACLPDGVNKALSGGRLDVNNSSLNLAMKATLLPQPRM